MATFYKRMGKWGVWIRRSFHKFIHKTFASKQDALDVISYPLS